MFEVKIITSVHGPEERDAVAAWVQELAVQHKRVEVELLDVAAINLPFMDWTNYTQVKQYIHDHTKKMGKIVDDANAFIL